MSDEQYPQYKILFDEAPIFVIHPNKLPRHIRDGINTISGAKVTHIPVRDCKITMAQLVLDMAKVYANVCEVEGTAVSETMYVSSLDNAGFCKLSFEHAADIRVAETVAFVRAEIIGGYLAAVMPRLHEFLKQFAIDRGHPSLPSLTAANGNSPSYPVEIDWEYVQCLIAAELGEDTYCYDGTISTPSFGTGEGVQDSTDVVD
jgi:hypothetical protein